jgi:hypothetical protein
MSILAPYMREEVEKGRGMVEQNGKLPQPPRGAAWDQAAYYQLLLLIAMKVPKAEFEQVERLAVLLLIALLIRQGGSIHWSLAHIHQEIGISDAVLNNTIRKLLHPENSFHAYLQVERTHKGATASYHLRLVEWMSEEHTPDEAPVRVPSSLAELLPQVFIALMEDVLWQEEQRFGDIIVHIKVARPPKGERTTTPFYENQTEATAPLNASAFLNLPWHWPEKSEPPKPESS